jgi:hypothetical protein
MERYRANAFGVAVLGALWFVSSGVAAESSNEGRIREIFGLYKAALTEQRGSDAASLVTGGTLDLYGDFQALALLGNKEQLSRQQIVYQLAALQIRAVFPIELLRSGSPAQIFATAVDQNLVGDNVSGLEVGQVVVSGDEAKAKVGPAGQPAKVTFRFEMGANGNWKIDLTAPMEIADRALHGVRRRMKMNNEDFVLFLLGMVVQKDLIGEIWEPPCVVENGKMHCR